MSIKIHMSKKLHESETESTVHYLPFKIKTDCEANTQKYFNPTIRSDDSGVLTASFRGYPLDGTKIDLPAGYTGMLMHETVKPMTEDDNRKFYATHKFKSFTYWNWDKLPSKNDTIQQAMDWIDVAEVLHAPVDDKEDEPKK